MDKRVVKDIITVVVVLGVLFLIVVIIGVSSTKKVMDRSRASAFISEGLSMSKAAQSAYQSLQMGSVIDSKSPVCFDLEYLYNNQYFAKGSQQGYHGSVLITKTGTDYDYVIWITNEKYYLGNQNYNSVTIENVVAYEKKYLNNINTCGSAKKRNVIYCTNTSCK